MSEYTRNVKFPACLLVLIVSVPLAVAAVYVAARAENLRWRPLRVPAFALALLLLNPFTALVASALFSSSNGASKGLPAKPCSLPQSADDRQCLALLCCGHVLSPF